MKPNTKDRTISAFLIDVSIEKRVFCINKTNKADTALQRRFKRHRGECSAFLTVCSIK